MNILFSTLINLWVWEVHIIISYASLQIQQLESAPNHFKENTYIFLADGTWNERLKIYKHGQIQSILFFPFNLP
jgi:hypothetical protein